MLPPPTTNHCTVDGTDQIGPVRQILSQRSRRRQIEKIQWLGGGGDQHKNTAGILCKKEGGKGPLPLSFSLPWPLPIISVLLLPTVGLLLFFFLLFLLPVLAEQRPLRDDEGGRNFFVSLSIPPPPLSCFSFSAKGGGGNFLAPPKLIDVALSLFFPARLKRDSH